MRVAVRQVLNGAEPPSSPSALAAAIEAGTARILDQVLPSSATLTRLPAPPVVTCKTSGEPSRLHDCMRRSATATSAVMHQAHVHGPAALPIASAGTALCATSIVIDPVSA
jgi:hypothetical protein